MDIKVTCDCGKQMIKIEDGRQVHTIIHQPHYPYTAMEFVCSCSKAVDVMYVEDRLHSLEEAQENG